MNTITLEKIKNFGEFIGFDENVKAWLYALEQKYYLINKDGLFDLAKNIEIN